MMAGPWEKYQQTGPLASPPVMPKQPPAQTPQQARNDKLQGKKLERELSQPIPKTPTQMEIENKAAGIAKRANVVRAQLARIRDLYAQDIKGQPFTRGFGATEYIDWLPVNERFKSAGSQILPMIRPMIAQTAKEGDSNIEMTIFESFVPSNDDSDLNIENKFQALEVLIDGMVEGKPPSELVKIYGLKPGEEVGLTGSVTDDGTTAAPADDDDALIRKYLD